jgi:arsenate reductase
MLIVYGYKACSTCRNAWKWLADNKIPHEARDIISQPPSRAELKACIDQGTPFKKLFNTSGQDYRALGLKDKISAMTESEALDLLTSNGKLIKRPFATDGTRFTVGFKVEDYKATWGS